MGHLYVQSEFVFLNGKNKVKGYGQHGQELKTQGDIDFLVWNVLTKRIEEFSRECPPLSIY